MLKKIVVKGAKEHNLKNVSLEIPKEKLVVITGLSGSGKSSLAFDTIYAEGQRRYVESLSSYARQFLDKMKKPKVDLIEGLIPAISIDQKNTTNETTGSKCPQNADKGWYIVLKDYAKITAEPTVYKGTAYFPVYEPTKSVNKCSLGNAYICGVDDECGTNTSSQLNHTMGKSNKCAYVGQGVLSKIVVFADK